MTTEESKVQRIPDELQWVDVNDLRGGERASKGVYDVLVPMGALVTCGVLGTGVYYMLKRDSRKQQTLMRCRIAAQGVTIALALLGIFHIRTSQ